MGTLADVQAALDVVAGGLQFLGFGHEQVGCNDASVADDVDFPCVEDSRGNAAEHILLPVEDDGVSCIGTTGKTGDNVIARCEYVHDFAFSFVSENDA